MVDQLQHGKDANHDGGYDRHEVNVRFVTVTTIITVVVIAVSMLVLYEYFVHEKEREIYELTLQPQSEKLVKQRAHEAELLHTYGISDSTTGAYRIPIDSAIRLMAAEAGDTSTGASGGN